VRTYSPRDLIIVGLMLMLLEYMFMQLNLGALQKSALDLLLFLSALWLAATLVIEERFDPFRIIYSFSWSFIVVVSITYIFLALALQLSGAARSLVYLLLPLALTALTGLVKVKVVEPLIQRRSVKNSLGRISIGRRLQLSLYRLDRVMLTFITVSLAMLVAFLITPVLSIFQYSILAPSGEQWYHNFKVIFSDNLYVRKIFIGEPKPWELIRRPDGTLELVITGVNYGVLVNSITNAVIVTVVATALGVLVAFALARYDFYGKTFLRVLAVVPLFVTPFINSYIVKLIFGTGGPISMIAEALFGFKVRIESLAGVALAQIMAFYPIVYLNAYSSFISIDPSMEEQAENLGSKSWRLFFTVTLPLALPGIAAGSILVFIFSLEDLGAPIVFNEHNLMSYKIYSSLIGEAGVVTPEIAALGVVLIALSVLGFLVIRSYVSMRAYAMVSRGGRWYPRTRKLGALGHALIYILLLPLIVFTALPQIGVVLMAFNAMALDRFSINPSGFTTKYVIEAFTGGSPLAADIPMHLRNTLTYATTAVLIATVLSITIAYVVGRAKIKYIVELLDVLATIPIAIPGLVIAIGYYYYLSTLSSWGLGWSKGTPLERLFIAINPIYGELGFQAWIVLITAFVVRRLPYTARSVFAGFQQVHENLEEAALNLGASRLKTISTVILPLIITNIVSGALIGFIYTSTEVSTSVTLGAFNKQQAPVTYYMMYIYKAGTTEAYRYAAAVGLLLIAIQLIVVIVVTLVLKQRYALIGI